MNFKVGQRIVCIADGGWVCGRTGVVIHNTPKYLEVCTILSFCSQIKGNLILCGYKTTTNGNAISFRPENFRPIEPNSASMEILRKFKPTEEKSDVRIKEYQPTNK